MLQFCTERSRTRVTGLHAQEEAYSCSLYHLQEEAYSCSLYAEQGVGGGGTLQAAEGTGGGGGGVEDLATNILNTKN